MENVEKKNVEKSLSEDKVNEKKETVEDKLKVVEEKFLRAIADMENQRRRFEKER